MEDELYPRDGAYYQPSEPEAQLRDKAEERAKAKSALPMLRDLVKRFEQRIAFYDSIQSIPTEIRSDNTELGFYIQANDLAKRNLQSELEYLETLIDQYK